MPKLTPKNRNVFDFMQELQRLASECPKLEGPVEEETIKVANRMHHLALRVPIDDVLRLALRLRQEGLRRGPVWMLNAALHHPARHLYEREVELVIGDICGSARGLGGELLMLFQANGRPIPKVMTRGFARAFVLMTSRKLLGSRIGEFVRQKFIVAPLNSAAGKERYQVLPSNIQAAIGKSITKSGDSP